MSQQQPFGLRRSARALATAFATAALVRSVAADDVLKTTSFSNCGGSADFTAQTVSIEYNRSNQTVTFDIAGTNTKAQNVTAILSVTAYGTQVYTHSFNPCDASAFISQLCPVPAGTFAASGSQAIDAQYASAVPAIAFDVPDISAQATLELHALDTDAQVACVAAQITNGKTADIPAVSYVAAGIAGAALLLGAVGTVTAAASGAAGGSSASAAAGGMGTISPSMGEVLGWFQGMAMNSMLSVNYPTVYRHFAKNFAFTTGLFPWTSLQRAIGDFRVATGGNLTNDSVQFLQNSTVVFKDGSASSSASSSLTRRLLVRAIETSINSTGEAIDNATDSNVVETVRAAVSGIEAYAAELSIPSASTFMTVLLIVAIIIASITVGLLLVKIVLEAWALVGRFPESLSDFRQHYWLHIARAITTLILLLYGVWVLYCMFQFTQGDSWAAKLLAGITLGLFTGVLAYFSYMIWRTARTLKHQQGDVSGLYDDQVLWSKYSLFYESYRKQYWWVFVPAIVYMFAKGVALAVGDGHGMAQTIAQLVIEAGMMLLLLWSRPYERRSSNVVNIVIQVVRVLSVVCILLFVEEFGIAETTQTVAGVVLIAVQSSLSAILALLIAWNAISACINKNPHDQRRKELLEKTGTSNYNNSKDDLTPLDARNSLLRGKSPLVDEEAAYYPREKEAAVAAAAPPAYTSADAAPAPTTRSMSPSSTRSLTPANGAIAQKTSRGGSGSGSSIGSRHSLLADISPMGRAQPPSRLGMASSGPNPYGGPYAQNSPAVQYQPYRGQPEAY